MPDGRWVHATNKAYSTCRMELIIRLSTIWSETRAHTRRLPSSVFSFLPFHFVLLISLECSEPLENSTLLNNGRRNYCTVSEAYETQTSASRHPPPHPKAAAKRDHKNVSLILVNNSTRNILKKDASACRRGGHTAANMLELTLSKSDTRAYSIQVSNMRLTPPYGFQVMSPFISSLRLSHRHTLIHLSPDTPPTIHILVSAL